MLFLALQLLPPESSSKRLVYLGIVVANAVIALLFEKLVIDCLIFGKLSEKYKWLRTSITHQAVERSLLVSQSEAWWNSMEAMGRVATSQSLTSMKAGKSTAPAPGSPKYLNGLSPSQARKDISYSNPAFVRENSQS